MNPDGQQPFKVWCDQDTAGGGWMMLTHIKRGGCGKRGTGAGEYKQTWANWLNVGIPDVDTYKGVAEGGILKHDSCYHMPFKNWARLVGDTFQSDPPTE